MSRSQFQSKRFILRHAWLNLWDERMTTGRINQVAIFFILIPLFSPPKRIEQDPPVRKFKTSLQIMIVIAFLLFEHILEPIRINPAPLRLLRCGNWFLSAALLALQNNQCRIFTRLHPASISSLINLLFCFCCAQRKNKSSNIGPSSNSKANCGLIFFECN